MVPNIRIHSGTSNSNCLQSSNSLDWFVCLIARWLGWFCIVRSLIFRPHKRISNIALSVRVILIVLTDCFVRFSGLHCSSYAKPEQLKIFQLLKKLLKIPTFDPINRNQEIFFKIQLNFRQDKVSLSVMFPSVIIKSMKIWKWETAMMCKSKMDAFLASPFLISN